MSKACLGDVAVDIPIFEFFLYYNNGLYKNLKLIATIFFNASIVCVEENHNLKLKKAIHMLTFSELNNNILVNLLIILLINYADNIELSMLSVILLMVFFFIKVFKL